MGGIARVCVYCGSSPGNDPDFMRAATRFGEILADNGVGLVYGGGGLLVAPGNLSRIENYNEQLWRDGSGILPAELQDATGLV